METKTRSPYDGYTINYKRPFAPFGLFELGETSPFSKIRSKMKVIIRNMEKSSSLLLKFRLLDNYELSPGSVSVAVSTSIRVVYEWPGSVGKSDADLLCDFDVINKECSSVPPPIVP